MSIDHEERRGNVAIAAAPAVCWRMDPTVSYSDWTIEVIRVKKGNFRAPTSSKSSEAAHDHAKEPQVDVFHVHRNILAFGPRSSQYFSAMFRMPCQETDAKMSQIQLEDSQADIFPLFLDSVYHGMVNESRDCITTSGEIIKSHHDSRDTITRGQVCVLSELNLLQLYRLGQLLDYFGCTMLKDTLCQYVREDQLRSYIDNDEQFAAVMADIDTVDDELFRNAILNQLFQWVTANKIDSCEKNIRTGLIEHKCPDRPHLCTEKLAVLAPHCVRVLTTPIDMGQPRYSFHFSQAAERMLRQNAHACVLRLSDHALIKCGFIEAWCRGIENEDAEGKTFWLTAMGKSTHLIAQMAEKGDDARDVLLDRGVLKSVSAWLLKCDLWSMESLVFVGAADLLFDLLESKHRAPLLDHVVDFIPALDRVVDAWHDNTYRTGNERALKRIILNAIYDISKMSIDDRMYIINHFDLPLVVQAAIHPDIQSSAFSSLYKHQTSSLTVVKSSKRKAGAAFDRGALVCGDVQAEQSILKIMIESNYGYDSPMAVHVLAYICQGGETMIDEALDFLEQGKIFLGDTQEIDYGTSDALIQLAEDIIAHGTIHQLARLLSMIGQNDSGPCGYHLAYYMLDRFIFKNKQRNLLIPKCAEAIEAALLSKERESSNADAEALLTVQNEAIKYFGANLRLIDSLLCAKAGVHSECVERLNRIKRKCMG